MKPLIEQLDAGGSAPAVFERLKNAGHSFFLDSGMDPHRLGRFSFLGCDPFLVLKSRGREVELTRRDGTRTYVGSDPLDTVREILDRYACEADSSGIPFTGGAVGYLGYDLGRLIEKLPVKAADDLGLPEVYLAFYDEVLAFDNLRGYRYLIARNQAGLTKLKQALAAVEAGQAAAASPACVSGLLSNFTRTGYIRAVERVRQYIIDGDIFQVNLSRRFDTPLMVPPYELYRRLRDINPAPFGAYLNFDDLQIVSSSPERFLKLQGNHIETRPIKGTRPRGADAAADQRLADELLGSEKDRAENVMIVDLERNDLGRVSEYGSVEVTELAELETYPTVFHLTSTVAGRLRSGRDRIDLIRAAFPGGSITGAPKVRAMEIIEELEPTRRSVYTGSIGYLGFDGGMDLNIAIRTILTTRGRAYFQVGGGIVYDSVPESEYRETNDKAQALARALGFADMGTAGADR